jgi:putative transcriptional regulator
MKKELFNELLQSVKEAAAIERGDARPSRKFEVKTANDVVRVRKKLGLPQTKFARLLGISEDTLQNWEQGRRKPAGPAKVLLKIAAKHPKIVLELRRDKSDPHIGGHECSALLLNDSLGTNNKTKRIHEREPHLQIPSGKCEPPSKISPGPTRFNSGK